MATWSTSFGIMWLSLSKDQPLSRHRRCLVMAQRLQGGSGQRKDHTSHMEGCYLLQLKKGGEAKGCIPLHLSFYMSSGKYVRISLHTFESHDQLTFSWVIIVTCSILNVMNMNMSGMFPQFVTSPHSVSKSLHTNVRILTLLDKSIVVSLLLRVFNFTHKSIISSLSCLQDA